MSSKFSCFFRGRIGAPTRSFAYQKPCTFYNCLGAESNTYETFVLVVCLGFFVFDCAACVLPNVYGKETLVFAAHHAVVMAGMTTSLYLGVSSAEICAAICLAECTNPMFQARWFMRDAALPKGDWRFELNDLAFVTSFMTLRGPVTQYLAHCVLTHAQPTLAIKTLALAFSALNAFLVIGMVEFVYRKYFMPFGEWVIGGGGHTTAAQPIGAGGEAVARLSNSGVSFEEISSHIALWLAFKRQLHKWKNPSKCIKQK